MKKRTTNDYELKLETEYRLTPDLDLSPIYGSVLPTDHEIYPWLREVEMADLVDELIRREVLVPTADKAITDA